MEKRKYRLSDFVIRPATPADYAGVMAISAGILWGTDSLPAFYHDYLRDPTRVFYVATHGGTVVSVLPCTEALW